MARSVRFDVLQDRNRCQQYASDIHAASLEAGQLSGTCCLFIHADHAADSQAKTSQGKRGVGYCSTQPPASGIIGSEVTRRGPDHHHVKADRRS
jgi:hypothetical protein